MPYIILFIVCSNVLVLDTTYIGEIAFRRLLQLTAQSRLKIPKCFPVNHLILGNTALKQTNLFFTTPCRAQNNYIFLETDCIANYFYVLTLLVKYRVQDNDLYSIGD